MPNEKDFYFIVSYEKGYDCLTIYLDKSSVTDEWKRKRSGVYSKIELAFSNYSFEPLIWRSYWKWRGPALGWKSQINSTNIRGG